jgi:hypothetical protein
MAESWEDFGAPEQTATKKPLSKPNWEDFGAPEQIPDPYEGFDPRHFYPADPLTGKGPEAKYPEIMYNTDLTRAEKENKLAEITADYEDENTPLSQKTVGEAAYEGLKGLKNIWTDTSGEHGISKETQDFLGGNTEHGMLLNPIFHAPAAIADLGTRALETLDSGVKGLADFVIKDGKEMVEGLQQAFPLFGEEIGGFGNFRTPIHDTLSPEVRAAKNAEADALFYGDEAAGRKPATFEEMNKWAEDNDMSHFGDDLKKRIEARDAKGPVVDSSLTDNPLGSKPLQGHVDTITKDWKNKPEIQVVDKHEDLPQDLQEHLEMENTEDAQGIHWKGKTYILGHNLEDPSQVASITYHEALGHHGLEQTFGANLDSTLESIYNNNKKFQAEVDQWRKDNDHYEHRPDALHRAAEEVLVEKLENGALDKSIKDRVIAVLSKYARKMGVKLDMTDAEIREILRQAQDTVINGKKEAVDSEGGKYMYLGRQAKGADLTKLDELQKRDREGQDTGPDSQNRKTLNWFHGYDGKSRFEISDMSASLKKAEAGSKPHEFSSDVRELLGEYNSKDTPEIRTQKNTAKGTASYFADLTNKLRRYPTAKELEEATGKTVLYKSEDFPAAVKNLSNISDRLGGPSSLFHEMKLEDVLDHPSLFANYPELKELPVKYNTGPDSLGHFVPGEKSHIGLNDSYKETQLSTVLHEVQHWIQDKEGFATGGSPTSILQRADPADLVQFIPKIEDGFKTEKTIAQGNIDFYNWLEQHPLKPELDKLYQKFRDGEETDRDVNLAISAKEKLRLEYNEYRAKNGLMPGKASTVREVLNSLQGDWFKQRFEDWTADVHDANVNLTRLDNIKKGVEDSSGLKEILNQSSKKQSVARDAYQNISGEIEARDVQDRQYLSKGEREDTTPYSSSDVNPDNHILLFREEPGSPLSKQANELGAKYMKRKSQAGNINLTKLHTSRAMDDLLEDIAKDIHLLPEQSHKETVELAKELGMTRESFIKSALGWTPQKIVAARMFLLQSASDTVRLSREYAALENPTEAETAQWMAQLARHATIQQKLQNITKVTAQNLDSFKIKLDNRGEMNEAAVKLAMGRIPESLRNDPEKMRNLALMIVRNSNDPRILNKIARDAMRTKGDLVTQVWYNMILSNPITHLRYWGGNLAAAGTDLASQGLAAAIGQPKRFLSPNADRVLGREVLARTVGSVMGIKQGLMNVFENITEAGAADSSLGKAAIDAMTSKNPSTANRTLGSEISKRANKYKAVGGNFLPTGILHNVESLFQGVLQSGDYWANAVRTAHKEGKGWDKARIAELINNPTEEMIASANEYSSRMQYTDPVGPVANILESWRNSPNTQPGQGALKYASRFIIPFVQRPDGIIRFAIRHSPAGALDRYNQADFLAGGARRDLAIARVAVGSAIALYIGGKVLNQEVTGSGPTDYVAQQQWLANGNRPYSYKDRDGNWVSYKGWGPMADMIGSTADLVHSYEHQDPSKEDFDKAASVIGHGARILYNDQWVSDMAPFMKALDEKAPESTLSSTAKNLIANQVSSMVVPAGVRQITQMNDPVVRDMRGDSLSEMIKNRIKGGIPGQTESLPVKLDAYGDPTPAEKSIFPTKKKETDSMRIEMDRLSEGKALFTGTPTKLSDDDGNEIKLTKEQKIKYASVTGQEFQKSLRQWMAHPSWKKMSDDDKREIIRELHHDATEVAKDAVIAPSKEVTPSYENFK